MIVRALSIRGVTKHANTRLDLPEKGVVLVTGDNGSGKSTLIEAVPFCLWGKSLRGEKLWTTGGKDGQASVLVDGAWVHRKQKGRIKLTWDGAPEHESTKHAQAELEASPVGTMAEWQRSAVLSSQDAANFTEATDAERKRLLEGLTGGDRLEGAYRLALEDKTALDKQVREVEGRRRVLDERVAGAKRLIAELVPPDTEGLPSPGEWTDEDEARLVKLRGYQRQAADEASQTQRSARAAGDDEATTKAALAQARREQGRLDRDACPTCGQAIPEELKERLRSAVAAAEAAQARAAASTAEMRERLTREAQELQAEADDLRRQADDLQRARSDAQAAAVVERQAAQMEARREQAAADLATAKAELAAVAAEQAVLEARLAHVAAAAKALSTRGVRAHLLGKTISAVEAAANAWLGRICDGRFKLHLEPYGKKADGSVKDQVSLRIEVDRLWAADQMLRGNDEAAFPQSYRASSGGERRRVDVALMFALAEVAEAAKGRKGSTIFCDEIFDALDEEGVARVSAAVRDLAEERCVLVVAHQAKDALRAVAREHWRVVRGQLERV